jgi:hypothetical protein
MAMLQELTMGEMELVFGGSAAEGAVAVAGGIVSVGSAVSAVDAAGGIAEMTALGLAGAGLMAFGGAAAIGIGAYILYEEV